MNLRTISATTLILVAATGMSEGPSRPEIEKAHSWAVSRFSGADGKVPFSFDYEGQSSHNFLSSWQTRRTSRRLDRNRTSYGIVYSDPKTGLVVDCEAVEYKDYPTVEWTLTFENSGKADTPILSAVHPLDLRLQRRSGSDFVLHYNTADNAAQDSYAPHEEPMPMGAAKDFASEGGRPTTGGFPYWNVGYDGGGALVVLSWAGQWSAHFLRDEANELEISGGQELTHFTLHPGEKVTAPLALVQFYDGDWIHGQNVWRRWMFAHNIPHTSGKLSFPMRYGCDGDLYPGLRTDLKGEEASIEGLCKEGLAPDTWDQDAGWYPCDPKIGWWQTGTWEPDTERFPGGVKALSDFLHVHGIKLILWSEPERAAAGTWMTTQHPDWVYGGAGGGLVKLGDPDCRKWITDHFDKLITEQGVDVYRQDFNIAPLAYWRGNDTPDRQGITEIRHVEGYYAYWDELRKRHPKLLIDSCASGGRRNNLQTLRRAVPILRSDYTGDPIGNQGHTYGISLWIPINGTGLYFKDDYNNRSAMAPIYGIGWDVKHPPADWNAVRRTAKQWKQLGQCMLGDYYPLTPYSLDKSAWIGWQFDLERERRGMVELFRRDEAKQDSIVVKLRGLDPKATYSVTNLDTGKTDEISGRSLMENGLTVSIPQAPGSALISYSKSK